MTKATAEIYAVYKRGSEARGILRVSEERQEDTAHMGTLAISLVHQEEQAVLTIGGSNFEDVHSYQPGTSTILMDPFHGTRHRIEMHHDSEEIDPIAESICRIAKSFGGK